MGLFKRKSKPITLGVIPKSGRSSEEKNFNGALQEYQTFFNDVNPVVPVELLRYLTLMAIVNPDMSQAVKNWVNVGNTGHSLVVTDRNTRRIDAAMERLNKQAYSLYRRSAGIDGLINHYFNQLAVSGAISSEDVIQRDLKGVDRVVIVPASSIRFKYEDGEYVPYQVGSLGSENMIRLNELTYAYYASATVENSPYALPPMVAALEPIITQRHMFENLGYLMRKIGLLGLTHVSVKPPPRKRSGETEEQFQRRFQQYLSDVADAIGDSYRDGLLVLPDDQKLEHHSVTGDARGTRDIVQTNEEQVFSGIGIDPAMAGRSYSTTETYAGVVYQNLINTASNLRRLVKRRLEQTYRLDLLLTNLDVEGLSVQFNPSRQLQPDTDALADQYKVDTVLKKVKVGVISPDQGAQELGYDEWYDEELLKAANTAGYDFKRFKFDRQRNEYVLQRQALNLPSSIGVSLESAREQAEEADKKLRRFVRGYLRNVLPFFDQIPEDVATWAIEYLQEAVTGTGGVDLDQFVLDVRSYISQHPVYSGLRVNEKLLKAGREQAIEIGTYYKEKDVSVFAGKAPADIKFTFGSGDVRAMEMLSKIDNYYFSKFVDNKGFGASVREYTDYFLEKGEALFEQWTEEAKMEFKARFASALRTDIEMHMERIIDSSIARVRLYSHIEQLNDAGFAEAEVVELMDMHTCEICRRMHGKRFPVGRVREKIQGFVNADSLDDALEWIKKTGVNSEEEAEKDMDDLLAEGRGWPPYHPRCHGSVRGVFE
jgi:hypothetical protein